MRPALEDRAAISLAELDSCAALMSRVDRKYFVPAPLLSQLLAQLDDRWHVLTIGGLRTFEYRTVYFDSPRFEFYRQQVQRRRHRHKVRTRQYSDTGACLLQVKSLGLRGRTLKQRIAHDPRARAHLDARSREYVSSIVGFDGAHLLPALESVYRRSTLTDRVHRITLDRDLEWMATRADAAAARVDGPCDVLVETKSDSAPGALDRMLVRRGIRPHSVSKYCLGASLLYPQLPGNDWARLRRRYWPGGTTER